VFVCGWVFVSVCVDMLVRCSSAFVVYFYFCFCGGPVGDFGLRETHGGYLQWVRNSPSAALFLCRGFVLLFVGECFGCCVAIVVPAEGIGFVVRGW